MTLRVDMAPLEGLSQVVFRRVWQRHFGGVDRLFIPFFSPTSHHLMTRRERRELDMEAQGPLPAVPQVMTRRAEDFLWACGVLRDMGYREVNLNLGCPSGTVTAKGKGCGFLARPEALAAFFDAVFEKTPLPVSVKTRLGYDRAEEFPALLALFNRYPLSCLILHPRIRQDKYSGPLRYDLFALALSQSRCPVCFNGDLNTPSQVQALQERFPALRHVMIGRGLMADPALGRKLRGGDGAQRAELAAFLDDLYQSYTDFYGGQAAPAAQRMREIWFYLIHLFDDPEQLCRRMRRFRTVEEYLQLQERILSACPLRTHSQGALV